MPHVAIRDRVGFPVSIKTTPYTAASKVAGTPKIGDDYKSLHAFPFAALITRSCYPLLSKVIS